MTSTDERALIYCITCGVEWIAHTPPPEGCSRHAFRPWDYVCPQCDGPLTDERPVVMICRQCGLRMLPEEAKPRPRAIGADAHGRALPDESIELAAAELEALPEYSASIPTGVTIGKRWRCNANEAEAAGPLWLVGEFVPGAKPETARVRWYRVNLTEGVAS